MELSSDFSQGRRPGIVIEPCSKNLGGRYVMLEYQSYFRTYIVDRFRFHADEACLNLIGVHVN